MARHNIPLPISPRADADGPCARAFPFRCRGSRWLELRVFQYNITFGLYMLEPWERLVFNAAGLLALGLVGFSVSKQAGSIVQYFSGGQFS